MPGWFDSRWGRLALFLAGVALFGAVFHPSFYVFDTYDYMFRSLHPSAFGAHPFLFGTLLRAIAALARPLWPNAFSQLFQIWQLACMAVALAVCLRMRALDAAALRGKRLIALVLLGAATLGAVLPSLIFLTNGYVSEPTGFALLALGAVVFARAHDGGRPVLWLIFAAICLLAFNVRYQLIVLPAAAAVAVLARCATRKVALRRGLRHLVPIAAALLAVTLSQRALGLFYTVDEFGKSSAEIFLRKSIQCTLGCSVRMFEHSCETRRGRKIILGSPCWKIVQAPLTEIGEVYPKREGMGRTLLNLGPKRLFGFVTRAPMNLLRSRQENNPLEIYGYGFDDHVYWFSEYFPDVIAHYGAVLPRLPDRPAPAFEKLTAYLQWLYDHWGFHWLSAAAFYGSLVALFVTRDPASACLYALTIATFLLFSYVQPQFPLRYAAHLALPAVLAAWRDFLRAAQAPPVTAPAAVANA